jgi:transglutaminase/protease-like cytokinesis protein 3
MINLEFLENQIETLSKTRNSTADEIQLIQATIMLENLKLTISREERNLAVEESNIKYNEKLLEQLQSQIDHNKKVQEHSEKNFNDAVLRQANLSFKDALEKLIRVSESKGPVEAVLEMKRVIKDIP